MLKTTVHLEYTVDGKTGHFYCDYDTSFPVAKEILFQFQKYLGQLEDSVKAAVEEKAAKEAEEKVESLPEPASEV